MLIDQALATAAAEDFVAHRGVYVAVTGPNLEARAEYRFLRQIGADVVVARPPFRKLLVAVHGGMRVLGLSVVTDMRLPDAIEPAAKCREILAVRLRLNRSARSCWVYSAKKAADQGYRCE